MSHSCWFVTGGIIFDVVPAVVAVTARIMAIRLAHGRDWFGKAVLLFLGCGGGGTVTVGYATVDHTAIGRTGRCFGFLGSVVASAVRLQGGWGRTSRASSGCRLGGQAGDASWLGYFGLGGGIGNWAVFGGNWSTQKKGRKKRRCVLVGLPLCW